MTEKERLMTLKTCLKGSRKRVYKNVVKAHKNTMDTPGGSQNIYNEIKSRLCNVILVS